MGNQGPAKDSRDAFGLFPPGHFYSPVPDFATIREQPETFFPDPNVAEIPGVDLRVPQQLEWVRRLQKFYGEMPFTDEPTAGARYFFANEWFSYADAIFLYGTIRELQPRRIIEIGSGFSSAVTLDTCEKFLHGAVELTFIDPYADRLRGLLRQGDAGRATVIEEPVQRVPLAVFDALRANDILFVDSTHVVKIGSDVARIVFEILPRLAPGVVVHFHDIFFPFEYPRAWVLQGRAWNEAYLLRAFLQFNPAFEILAWNQFLASRHAAELAAAMPLCMKNPGGSLWLRRTPAASSP